MVVQPMPGVKVRSTDNNTTCKIIRNTHIKSFLSGCTRQSLAESDDTRGCICTICVVDLLMMGGMRSKHVEDFN